MPTFFGTEIERAALVAGGLLVLLLVPHLHLPRGLATPLTTVASASLGIYLTHFALLPLLVHGVPSMVEVPLDLLVGVAAWWTVGAAVRRVVGMRDLGRAPDRLRADQADDPGAGHDGAEDRHHDRRGQGDARHDAAGDAVAEAGRQRRGRDEQEPEPDEDRRQPDAERDDHGQPQAGAVQPDGEQQHAQGLRARDHTPSARPRSCSTSAPTRSPVSSSSPSTGWPSPSTSLS